jgi:photosystem II stability/assembly factor-like uncharacterized protein
MRTIYLLLIALLIPLSVNSQWTWQNPYPCANYPNNVQFVTSNIGFICGYAGMVMKSTNAGSNWNILPYVTNRSLNYLSSQDGNVIYAVGDTGTIIKSINGGDSWTNLTSGVTSNLLYVYMVDNNNVWAVGNNNTILRTINGGSSWDSRPVTGVSYGWNCCYFYDANTGYVGGGYLATAYIYKTTNAGVNWTSQTMPASPPGYIKDMKFINQNTGVAVGATSFTFLPKIIYTNNGGATWTLQYTGATNNTSASSVTLANSTNSAWVSCYNGLLLKTTNLSGGAWVAATSPSSTSNLGSISFFDINNGIIAGTDATGLFPRIYKTINGGGSWASPYYSVSEKIYTSVIFKDANNGFVAGDAGIFLKTINGGTNWEVKTAPSANMILSMSFPVDAMNGWVAGASGSIYKTPNAGTSWTSQGPGIATSFYGIQMLNTTTGWACGTGGYFYKTTDGSTWTSSASGTSNNLWSLFFIDANTGWITGAGGIVRKTVNGGGSFTPQTSNFSNILYSVYFVNANTGFLSGQSGSILKTVDGGTTWNFKLSGGNIEFKTLYFVNSTTGWAVGTGGTPFVSRQYKTTDGGENWFPQSMNAYPTIWSVYFIDANTGWAVGTQSSILKTSTGGGIFVNNISTEVPDNYYLHQNYPNPFNPSTNIRFEILKNENVTLTVYDMLGREISTLVNEKMQPGTYEVTFDGSNLPSGAYFYRLTSGNFVETKKMLLIK